MSESATLTEYISHPWKTAWAVLGILVLPPVFLFLAMFARELLTGSMKAFQDAAGLTIVYTLSLLGPVLTLIVPRVRIVHWAPAILMVVLQCTFMAIAKPVNEWWLIYQIAPFTIGTPVVTLLLYKLCFAPRFGPVHRPS